MWSGRAFPPQVFAYAAQKEEARSSERTRPALGRPSERKTARHGGIYETKFILYFTYLYINISSLEIKLLITIG